MNIDNEISKELKELTLENVELFDRDVTDGKTREFYESCEIKRATVYRNKLLGSVGTFVQGHDVQVSLHQNEISSTCTCSESRQICTHAVALLYSWIFDGKDFVNVANILKQLEEYDKETLLQIVKNIIQNFPQFIDVFLAKDKADWDEIDIDPLT